MPLNPALLQSRASLRAGYGRYYLCINSHQPGNRSAGFTFAPAHTWTLDPLQ